MIHVWTLTSWMEYLLTPSRSVATVTRPHPTSLGPAVTQPIQLSIRNATARVQQQPRAGPATGPRGSSNKPAPVQQQAGAGPAGGPRQSSKPAPVQQEAAPVQQQTRGCPATNGRFLPASCHSALALSSATSPPADENGRARSAAFSARAAAIFPV